MAGGQDQKSSSNLYSRLTRGRSKPNLKTPTSSNKDGSRGSALGSVPGTPTLSLPSNFGGNEGHDLKGEAGISKWMTEEAKKEPPAQSAPAANTLQPDARLNDAPAGDSVSRTYDIAEFTARRSAEMTSIAELQTRLLQEMKEKGELMSKYEALSSQHMSLQKDVSAARARAGSTSTLTSAAAGTGVGAVAGAGVVEAKDARDRAASTTAPSTADTTGGAAEPPSIRGPSFAPSIAASTHTAAHTVDEVFREEMNRCAVSLQAWVSANWAKEELDFEKAALKHKDPPTPTQANHKTANGAEASAADAAVSPTTLDKGARRDVLAEVANIAGPDYKVVATRHKVPFLTSLAAARLMEIFEDDFFFGLPSLDDGTDLAALRQSFRLLQAAASGAGTDGVVTADVNAWRAHSAILLRKLAESNAALRTHTEQLVFGLSSSIDALLASVTGAESSAPRREQLRAVVARVVELARLFRAQLAVFEFALPGLAKGDVAFDKATMADGGEDGAAARRVELATWPTVARLGDENGQRTVVAKARVVCADS